MKAADKLWHNKQQPEHNLPSLELLLKPISVFAPIGRNGDKMDLMDEKKKKDIKKVLHDQFCDLEIEVQGNTCSIQNLKYRVMGISCEVFQIS